MATNSHLFERRQAAQTPMRSRGLAPEIKGRSGPTDAQRAQQYLKTGQSLFNTGQKINDTFFSDTASAVPADASSFNYGISEAVQPASFQTAASSPYALGETGVQGGSSVFSAPAAGAGAGSGSGAAAGAGSGAASGGSAAAASGGGMSAGGMGAGIGIAGNLLGANERGRGNTQTGNQISGASTGASMGSALGPWGMLAGAAIGNEMGRGVDPTSGEFWKGHMTGEYAMKDLMGFGGALGGLF